MGCGSPVGWLVGHTPYLLGTTATVGKSLSCEGLGFLTCKLGGWL